MSSAVFQFGRSGDCATFPAHFTDAHSYDL